MKHKNSIFFLIGHRGAGKTSTLKILEKNFLRFQMSVECVDLDEEIVKEHGSIEKIFQTQNEPYFRHIEQQVLKNIIDRWSETSPLMISLGAGFEGDLSDATEVIWIRRESDSGGRIFLDRPRLNPKLSPLDEWGIRFKTRELNYQVNHSQILTLPEGLWNLDKVIASFFSQWFSKLKVTHQDPLYDVTFLPEDKNRPHKVIYQNARKLEVRDDLTGPTFTPEHQAIYFAHRQQKSTFQSEFLFEDWDLALGDPQKPFWSYSLHEGEFTPELTSRLPKDGVLKWAPEVTNFEQLYKGHEWFLTNPQRHVFLPRSKTGRWRWYRRVFGPQMRIHFARENKGSSLDQPFWFETLETEKKNPGFAAVIGQAVDLSFSPSIHQEFFRQLGLPMVSINIDPEEFDQAFEILKKLGLRACAVTSPHKKRAFEKVSYFKNKTDRELKSINTLWIDKDKVWGINTDLLGLQKLATHSIRPDLPLVIWGGGGLLPVLKQIFPQSECVFARKGKLLTSDCQIIWASVRSEDVVWPSPAKFVKKIWDMNYFENSMGRELALEVGCEYVSGKDFFEHQAQEQQKFWSEMR